MSNTDIREIVEGILIHRKLKNPRYSFRALARDLKVSPSHLHNVTTGKRAVTSDFWSKLASLTEADQELNQAIVSIRSLFKI